METSGPTSVGFALRDWRRPKARSWDASFAPSCAASRASLTCSRCSGSLTRGTEHFQIGDDRRQNIVEIVRDAAGELADRLHLLRLAELILHLLAAGQVANEAGEDPPAIRSRFPHRQFHREVHAGLREPLHQPSVADDPRFAGLEIVADVAVMLGPVGFGHEHPDVPPDHFLGAISEQFRRRGAEGRHQAPLVDHDHRLGHGVEDRTQVRLARRELRLGPLQPGDIVIGLKHEADCIVFGLSRHPQAGDRNDRSGFDLMFEFALPAPALAQCGGDLGAGRRISGL